MTVADSVTVTYTGEQVKISTPGSAVLSSSYEVLEDYPRRCVMKNGKDIVAIEFAADDDHMVIDRRGNALGANMKMHRARPVTAAPSATPSATSSVTPVPVAPR